MALEMFAILLPDRFLTSTYDYFWPLYRTFGQARVIVDSIQKSILETIHFSQNEIVDLSSDHVIDFIRGHYPLNVRLRKHCLSNVSSQSSLTRLMVSFGGNLSMRTSKMKMLRNVQTFYCSPEEPDPGETSSDDFQRSFISMASSNPAKNIIQEHHVYPSI